MAEELEETQIELRTTVCTLDEASLRELCTGLQIELKEETIPSFKKEFKISGQIGDSRQKDRLSFTSLAHQINAGLNRGYQEKEVTEAVIRAINAGLRLRSYLEGKPDLTLATLRKILRSHYQEKGATEEDGSNFKYDPKLVRCMFLHSLLTGLRSDSIKLEVKPYLQNPEVTDEELFKKLNVAVSNEMERWKKLGTRREQPTRQGVVQQVAQLPSSSENQSSAEGKTPEKPVKVNLLTEVREMKAELAAIKETMGNQRNPGPNQYRFVERERPRPRGCLRCQREGVEYRCDHCYKCGQREHFSYQCPQQWVQRSENLQGNGRGSLPRDREQPRRGGDSPNNV